MQVIGYVRVSTQEQATGGVSLEAQANKIRLYCELHELQLVDVIVDAGVSAKTVNRPGLQRALSMLRAGKAGGLVIAKLDRLTRSVADLSTLITTVFNRFALHSVADAIDTTSAAGRLVLHVLGSVAQWERETVGERTRDALAHKRARGERVGQVPFGFVSVDGRLVPHADEQRAITIIAELRADGMTYRAIADALTARGIVNKAGRTTWAGSMVYRIHTHTRQAA